MTDSHTLQLIHSLAIRLRLRLVHYPHIGKGSRASGANESSIDARRSSKHECVGTTSVLAKRQSDIHQRRHGRVRGEQSRLLSIEGPSGGTTETRCIVSSKYSFVRIITQGPPQSPMPGCGARGPAVPYYPQAAVAEAVAVRAAQLR
eukprot:GHVU01102717.1.p1 GENE.GHVU01102717.1~~GHVU01102717.1.p1  ORF type:complete len:147 (+),score=4.84 GHVU01102717.1:291-731(+)